MPFVLLSVTVLVWGLPAVKPLGTPAVKEWLDRIPPGSAEMPGLHRRSPRARPSPATPRPTPRRTSRRPSLDIVPVSSTGTAVFLAAVLSGLFLGVGPVAMARMLGRTVVRLVPAIAAIVCMLALGFVTK